jgi:hypothetical protein
MLRGNHARIVRDIYLKEIEERAESIAKAAKAIRTGVRYNDQPCCTCGEAYGKRKPEAPKCGYCEGVLMRKSPSVEDSIYYNEPGEKTLREALDSIETLDYTFTGCFEA